MQTKNLTSKEVRVRKRGRFVTRAIDRCDRKMSIVFALGATVDLHRSHVRGSGSLRARRKVLSGTSITSPIFAARSISSLFVSAYKLNGNEIVERESLFCYLASNDVTRLYPVSRFIIPLTTMLPNSTTDNGVCNEWGWRIDFLLARFQIPFFRKKKKEEVKKLWNKPR